MTPVKVDLLATLRERFEQSTEDSQPAAQPAQQYSDPMDLFQLASLKTG
jgi:hypothetical protein